MSKSINQKIKLLALWDILLHNTDENRALSTDEIIALLKEKNIDVARKVLPEDIALLNEFGYEVLSYKKKSYYYYVVTRPLETARSGYALRRGERHQTFRNAKNVANRQTVRNFGNGK